MDDQDTTAKPALKKRSTGIEKYVKKVRSIEKKKAKMLSSGDDVVNDAYQKLVQENKITCKDAPDKETKIDRILTVESFPDKNFAYRDVVIGKDITDVMAKDWEYSSTNKREIFRTLCMDPASGDVHLSTDRVEGEESSVEPNWDLCETSFPGKGYTLLGGMHTHPDFLDKPLESMGDVLVFSTSDKEMLACTVTKWGALCMFRMKDPAAVFDVPAIDPASDPEKPVPVRDKNGKIVYDVKSDVVDWHRAMLFSNRGAANSMFIIARGDMSKGLTESITRVPWFKPDDKEKSIGTLEIPFQFGVEKSKPKMVKDMRCESFVDIVGANTKVRTVCDDDAVGKNYYVESEITPGRLFFYENNGFPSNFYSTRDVTIDSFQPLPQDSSKFWDYTDPKRPGYHATRNERAGKMMGADTTKKTVRAGAFKLDGEYQCEYLLLPFPEGQEPSGTGKPGGLLCRKPEERPGKACILT